jgi:hypothetical protein
VGLPFSSGGAAVVALGSAEPNNFFVIFTISTTHYTDDPISLIELNPLILLASSATTVQAANRAYYVLNLWSLSNTSCIYSTKAPVTLSHSFFYKKGEPSVSFIRN